jgi:hypothetical protein
MNVTDIVFELNVFKVKISAILKRHCCQRNGSWVSSLKKSNPLDVVLHASEINNSPNTRLQIVSFPFYNITVAIDPP